MRSTVAVFDLDGTLLKVNTSFLFAFYLFRRKALSFYKFIWLLLYYVLYKIGLLSMANLHKKVFKKCFFQSKLSDLEKWLPDFLDQLLPNHLYPPAWERLSKALIRGDELFLFSSSPRFLVAPVAERLGIKNIEATDYLIDKGGVFCDIANIVDGTKKARYLLDKAREREAAHTIAYTDSILDLPLLEAVVQAVVVRPDRRLKKIARLKEWERL